MAEASTVEEAPSLRRRLHIQLAPQAWPSTGLSPLNIAACLLIVTSAALAVLETERGFIEGYYRPVVLAEWVFASIFAVEYLVRLWVAGEDARYSGPFGRLRYAATPAAIIDLLAILPVLLAIGGSEVFLLRLFRLLRLMRLARLGRFSDAMTNIAAAIRSRGPELLLSLGAGLLLLVASSSFLYLVEGGTQPQAFGSIPRAMWWSIATLTTVGYGDVYPITPLGRLFAAVTAITGIGLIAMPTGILAAAFSDVLQTRRRREKPGLTPLS
jgi:voltage-gated potassium channel